VPPVVEARGLRKVHGSGPGTVVALDGVDVDVARGRLTAVTGTSGSGKSTLLHCLAGIARPDAGTVRLDGTDLAALDDDARSDVRAQRMAFVFQTLNLLPALTVAENVDLPLLLRRLPAGEIRQRRDDALERLGLAGRGSARPAELSGGEQLRAALGRAVASRPEVLWADEPTGALDSASAADVLAVLRTMADGGTTVVVVTHAPEVAAAADEVVRLADGRRTA
jgi:putative ABC transport system ATP-binding protein